MYHTLFIFSSLDPHVLEGEDVECNVHKIAVKAKENIHDDATGDFWQYRETVQWRK